MTNNGILENPDGKKIVALRAVILMLVDCALVVVTSMGDI